MEIKQVYIGIALAVIVSLAFFYWVGDLNSNYVGLGGNEVNNSIYGDVFINTTADLGTLTENVGNTTKPQAGLLSNFEAILGGASNMFSFLTAIPGIIMRTMDAALKIIAVPPGIITIVKGTLIFVLSITLVYLLFLGARRISA
jgi:hypothetical protein